MSQEADFSALQGDLGRLYEGGSAAAVLVGCHTVTSLSPVIVAVEAGARQVRSARLFLELVATHLDPRKDTAALVGAALAGIQPPSTGRGVRDEPGKGERARAAGDVAGGRAAKTVARKRDAYLQAYAESVIAMAARFEREPELMGEFLRQCFVGEKDITRLTAHPAPSTAAGSVGSPDGSVKGMARSVPLAGALRAALEAARASCAAKGRAFYTSDLLLALVDVPGDRVASCLDDARAGAADQVRDWLHRSLAALATENTHPFHAFEWIERPEVRLAQELALEDGTGIVTELHLLLGVIDGESVTTKGLNRLLQPDFDTVRAIVDQRRRNLPGVLPTPGPGG